MVSRQLAVMGSMLYGLAIAAAAIWASATVLVILCVVGGPIVGMLYWASSQGPRREHRDETAD